MPKRFFKTLACRFNETYNSIDLHPMASLQLGSVSEIRTDDKYRWNCMSCIYMRGNVGEMTEWLRERYDTVFSCIVLLFCCLAWNVFAFDRSWQSILHVLFFSFLFTISFCCQIATLRLHAEKLGKEAKICPFFHVGLSWVWKPADRFGKTW